MNESEFKEMLDTAWRRRLTESELEAATQWVGRHPKDRPELEQVLAASQGLGGLPDVEVPSNFMARVWDGVERVERVERMEVKAKARAFGWRFWLPRFASAGAAVMIVAAGWWRYDAGRRAEVASGIATAADAAQTLDPAMLREFEALKVMSEVPAAVDEELLAALQ